MATIAPAGMVFSFLPENIISIKIVFAIPISPEHCLAPARGLYLFFVLRISNFGFFS
jgi:hypothetical protein